MQAIKIRKLVFVALFAAMNIVGSYIALALKLPIYLDCLGTVLAAILFGPIYGAGCAIVSGLVNATMDYFALFFIPVGMLVGVLTGLLYQRGMLQGRRFFPGTILITLVSSAVASVIVAVLFGGMTSSGSSYIVQWLHANGLSVEVSVFTVQLATDYLDKLIAIGTMLHLAKRIPSKYLKGKNNGQI